ncbi:hypothetical protein FRB94_001636 [Tulasnella sp. JGI-2019a]|nr:hypothetical protein FRB93_011300 [Tulasnella sp. JGI-2019a]KAG9005345.1 hypothetical protein FRB94_001636 [Tulasnella sp. JGI-2019a]
MPGPRVSYGVESTREAALQAEFNEKKWVWVPDDKEGYLAGWVVNEEEEDGDVVLAAGGDIRRVPLMMLSKMNPPKFDRVDDIADLTFLNEASVVHNLRLRYGSGAIYTYSGLFLVAINPYTHLPLYTDAVIAQYRGKRRDENPPHIFSIAERAWVNMQEERENQSILITGESGAGKTENTKKVIQYLAAIASDSSSSGLSHSRSSSMASLPSNGSMPSMPTVGLPRSSSFKRTHRAIAQNSTSTRSTLGLLERQILQANPILEAFGNAQTQRNNNSSRFGKFIRIAFASDGSIAGANIDWYLLEKSRVTARSEAERSFHVFYHLLESNGSLRDALLLDGTVVDYQYLNKSRAQIDGVDDREEWRALKSALDVVGVTNDEQFDLFRIVAAILHIGNIEITEDRANQAQISVPAQAEKACHLLGVPVPEFTKAVLKPRVLAGREWVSQARTKQQAMEELAALCKTLYEKSFGALVARINLALDRPSNKTNFIGVLDIAGFEIFIENSFEQLCINYTNERLQQFFNHHMFILEQDEYQREGIEWNFVNFGLDLQPTIDLIEAREPIGLLSCLDEECIMPRATDATFTQKLHSLWTVPGGVITETTHPGVQKYAPSRFGQGFIIQHYAGRVEYKTDGWLEKNKDPLNDNLTRILSGSSERYVTALFQEYSVSHDGSGFVKKRVKKGAFRTVAQRHKEQLSSLMSQLQATQPHFVRCIVPNGFKKPGRIDVPLVLDQLRCNGVLEGIRIARLGYPNRLPFAEFRQRYEVMTPGILPPGYMDGRKACARMVDALELDPAVFKIGTSKIFFRAGVLADLEERRDGLLFDIFSRVQAAARRFTARRQMKKILNRAVAVRTIQRNARVYGALREWPWWQLYTKIRPMLAATRNDEELRKKELELALARERADRDKREKQALESLKTRLEAEKRKVEDDLQAERDLALDKDQILERSKKREAELEEDILALQADLDMMDSQLDRAIASQKASDEKHKDLKEAFDKAAEHLVRLEAEEQLWKEREAELMKEGHQKGEEWSALSHAKVLLEKEVDDAKRSLQEKDEDLRRVKDRLESSVVDLEGKLAAEIKNREAAKAKNETLEKDTRQMKEQLAELSRSATEYEGIIQKKETEIERLSQELAASRREGEAAQKEIAELTADMDTMTKELEAQAGDRDRVARAKDELQSELDELRKLMAAKTTEETKRTQAERSKEQELSSLRTQSQALQDELADVRRMATDSQNKLKVDLERVQREHDTLLKSHVDLEEKTKSYESNLADVEFGIVNAEKAKRAAESELQAVRTRQIDLDGQLAEATKAKETLERQLTSAHTKQQDFEDVVLQIEREKASWARQMEHLRKELDTELSKRTQLEKSATAQNKEMTQLKDRCVKLDRDLVKAQNDIHHRDWELNQMRSKQDKTIVEHVHVLQEAKAFTDRQLVEAQAELEKQKVYIKSLEKAKTRLIGESEDLVRETERERQELRAKEKAARANEERAQRAQAEIDTERRSREAAELQVKRAQEELANTKSQLADTVNRMSSVQRAKTNLESELASLADEFDSHDTMAKVRKQYEARISQLEGQLQDSDAVRGTADRIRQSIERQHAELRRLIASGGPKDDTFRSKFLRELEMVDRELQRDGSSRSSHHHKGDDSRAHANAPPSTPSKANGANRNLHDAPRTPDRQAIQQATQELRHQVQALELQMVASGRVRQHLESSLRELTEDLDNSDGSKQSLQSHRAKLARENARLMELLDDEGEARQSASSAQMDGVKAMWDKFQNTIKSERESYSKLEESRRALLAQQRAAQTELEDNRRQVTELSQAKKKLQAEVMDLRERVEVELLAKTSEADAKRKMQSQLQELEMATSASSVIHTELRQALELSQSKAEQYLSRLEAAEITKAKAVRAETLARQALETAEKGQVAAVADRKAAEARITTLEQQVRDLEARLEDDNRGYADAELLNSRLAEEMESERDQYQKDLSDRDFTIDQTRQKYQTELAQLSEELQFQRDSLSRLREENRKIRGEYDDLQLRYDDEVYNGGAWKKEKERFETKIADVTAAYETSTAAQSEQQSQIVSLLSQVRELRRVLDEAEAERSSLMKARRTLEARLNDIAQEHADTNKMSSDRVLQALHLEKQSLKMELEEQTEKTSLAAQKLRKAETFASDCQVEVSRVRLENTELEKQNANLEKIAKDLNVRVVDLEARALTSSQRPPSTSKRLESKIEELTGKLQQESKEKSETVRAHRSADKTARDIQSQLAESDRQRARLEDELRKGEARVDSMKQSLNELQTSESELQLAKRRAEREAADYKQRSLNLERELERLKSRLEHPSALLDRASPRKL